jgi:hypothetical protein
MSPGSANCANLRRTLDRSSTPRIPKELISYATRRHYIWVDGVGSGVSELAHSRRQGETGGGPQRRAQEKTLALLFDLNLGRREYRAGNRRERHRRRRPAWPYWRCGPPAPPSLAPPTFSRLSKLDVWSLGPRQVFAWRRIHILPILGRRDQITTPPASSLL